MILGYLGREFDQVRREVADYFIPEHAAFLGEPHTFAASVFGVGAHFDQLMSVKAAKGVGHRRFGQLKRPGNRQRRLPIPQPVKMNQDIEMRIRQAFR